MTSISRTDRRPAQRPSSDDDHLATLIHAVANLNNTMGQLDQGLKTRNAIATRGAVPRVIVNGLSGSLSRSPGVVAGFALRETAGAPAVVKVYDSADANGDLILPVALLANQSLCQWLLPKGISYTLGLFVQVVSGSIEGAIFTGTA